MFKNKQQRMMNAIHRFDSCGESWPSHRNVSKTARRLALNTNAKTIGLLLVLSLGAVGSPAVGQTPAAVSDAGTGIVDVRKQSSELLRRARVAMKGGSLDLAERFIKKAEDLDAPQTGILSRFADTPEKARKDLSKLREIQAGTGVAATAGPDKGTIVTLPATATLDGQPLPSQVGAAAGQHAVKARSIMAQAKAAFDRGDLKLADSLTRKAAQLQVPDNQFSGGDTPWELGMKIEKQLRLTGNVPSSVAPVVAANTTQQVVPAVYNATEENSYVRQASAEEAVLPPIDTLAQQARGLNPLMQQPAPMTVPSSSIPNAGIVSGQGNYFPPTTSAAPIVTNGQSVNVPTPATTTLNVQQPVEGNFAPAQGSIVASPAATEITIGPNDLIKMGEEKLRARELEDAREYFRQAWALQDQLDPATKQRLQEHLQLIQNDMNRETEEGATEEEKQEVARLNRLLADVSREQVAIRRETTEYPKQSWEKMKNLRQKLSDADLPADTRRRWVEKIDADIAEIERYIETNRSQIELDETNRDVLAKIERDRQLRIDVQNQLAKSVEEFNTLMDQQRFSEAYVLAKQAREIDPHNEVTEMMLWKSQFASRLYVERELQARSNDMFTYATDANELGVPDAYTLSEPIKYPKEWSALVKSREGLMANRASRYNDAERAIERSLQQQVSVQFDRKPLGEVIETLGEMTGVNVFIDTEGLAAEGVTTDTPVTMNLRDEISLRSVLNLILGQYRLGYVIQDEVLRITSEQARAGDVYTETYYVGDLVIPIPNFMPGHNNGLAGALAQAYSALGYGPGGFAQNRVQNAPLVIAESAAQQENVGSPLALAQVNGNSTSLPPVPGMPQPPGVGGMGGASGADFDSLINLITSTVEPDSWDDVGGPGTVQPFDGNLSLVVSNTQEVHEAIVNLLEQLRRLQDLQVTIEVRFVTLQDNFFERIGVDFDFDINDNTGLTSADLDLENTDSTFQEDGSDITIGLDPSGNPTVDLDLSFNQDHFGAALPQFGGFAPGIASSFGFAILSDIEAFFLIEAIQGDQRTNVMQAPKVTLFNGQFATINDTQNRPFVTSVIPVVGDFAVAQQPVIMVLAEGTQLSVQAVVSSDRRFVRLTMMPMFSQIGDVDTFTFEGRRTSTTSSSSTTDPNDNTQASSQNDELFTEGTTVQLPNFATTSVSTTVSVPDGGTVLMGGIKRLAEGRTERGMPILGKLPYISRLFKNVGTGRETQTLMMMVTPRIIIQEEEEEKVLGTPLP